MNEGLAVLGRGGKPETLPKTNFFIGCVVSPFKRHERELVPQYLQAGPQDRRRRRVGRFRSSATTCGSSTR